MKHLRLFENFDHTEVKLGAKYIATAAISLRGFTGIFKMTEGDTITVDQGRMPRHYKVKLPKGGITEISQSDLEDLVGSGELIIATNVDESEETGESLGTYNIEEGSGTVDIADENSAHGFTDADFDKWAKSGESFVDGIDDLIVDAIMNQFDFVEDPNSLVIYNKAFNKANHSIYFEWEYPEEIDEQNTNNLDLFFKKLSLLDEDIVGTDYDGSRIMIFLETGKGYGNNHGWRTDSYIKDGKIYKTKGNVSDDIISKIEVFITDNILTNYPEVDHVVVSQELD